MSAVLIILIGAAVVGILANWLAAKTAREITIPVEGMEFPHDEVKGALERTGCVVMVNEPHKLMGTLPGRGGSWGQEVTVKFKDRCAFLLLATSGVRVGEEPGECRPIQGGVGEAGAVQSCHP
jgi:hypothetical protein